MRQHILLIDVAIAAIAALLLILLGPGLAIVGLVALLAIIICGLSFAVGRVRRRLARRGSSPGRRGPSMGPRGPLPRRELGPPPPLRPASRRHRRAPR